jgi:tetratricopeptide (TPR) repeat protein
MIFFILTISLIGQNYIEKELIWAKSSSAKKLQASFGDSLVRASSIKKLYRLDSLLLSKGLYEESKTTEKKLIEVIRKNNDYIHSSLANKYLSWGIKDLKERKNEKGKRKIEFAGKLDPSNRHIHLILAKLSFPNLIRTAKYLLEYTSTINFLNNKVFLIKILILLLILFSFCILLATVGASSVFFVSYATKWLQATINISGLWIGAILLAMFVWLPIQIVFLILIAMSLSKMNRHNLARCATILILLPFLISYSYIISSNFNPNSSIYKEFKTRFNPYNYELDSPVTPYGYSIKGIKEAKKRNFAKAKDFFEKGYNMRRDVNYLENLCSVYYDEGDTARAINMGESIISNDPQNEIANITIIQIFYDRLDFDEAEAHMDRTGFRLRGISNMELPIYNYPPENWLYKYIFVPRGLFKRLANKNLYILIIIGICIAIMAVFKKEKENYCPICKSLMLTDKNKEKMCLSCIKKLSLTKSKSIRERLKRRITTKAYNVDKTINTLMSLIIPGSAHFYKKKHLEGMIISFFAAVLLLISLNSASLQIGESLQYRTNIGNNIFIISVILFYSLLILSSWRLEPHGNGR